MYFLFVETSNSPAAALSSAIFKPIEIPKTVRRLSSLTVRSRETLDDYMNQISGDFKTVLEQIKAERYFTFTLNLLRDMYYIKCNTYQNKQK